MTKLISILLSDIAPIFAIAGVGYLLERRISGGVKALSSISFYALSPCLIFNLLVTSTPKAEDAARMAAFCVFLICIMGVIAWLVAGLLHLQLKTRTSFILTIMISNSGNYAMPVIDFSMGREGLSHATVYFVASAVLTYSLGVFIAMHGKHGFRKAAAGLVRIPALYALAVAAIILWTHTSVPLSILRPVEMLSNAAIPMMILVLGMQFKRATFPTRPAAVLVAAGISLLVAPLVGAALTSVLGMTGLARNVAIVVSAMPAAVITTVLALEFDLDSNLVTSVVFLSTLISPLTLMLLLAYLQSR